MKTKILVLLLSVITIDAFCQSSQEETKMAIFQNVIELFPELKIPSKRKDGIRREIKKVNKAEAIKYLHFTEEDLKMNDYDYDYDEDIRYDNWVDVLPGALGKISKENHVTLVYALLKSPTSGLETYKVMLTTFTYGGQIIDSIVVRSQYTREEDWKDVVFLENNILRIFDYKPNAENYNISDGAYYIIDENEPQTIVEISDYQINENGEINLVKTYPKQYLKEFVSFYRSYHENSDDPMNEY